MAEREPKIREIDEKRWQERTYTPNSRKAERETRQEKCERYE